MNKSKDIFGWLKKQGGVMKTWHRRWYMLNGHVLFYSTRQDDIKTQGSYFLGGQRIIVHAPNVDEPDKYIFEICADKARPETESVVLCAASDEERKFWVKGLTWALYGGKGGAIFGHSIEDTMKYEHEHYRAIPSIIETCVEYLLKNGIENEGIFRLPGRTSLIRELKEKFDSAERVSLESGEVDVHTVASLLKLYLRELPESIVPCEFYQKFMNIALKFQETKEEEFKSEHVMSLQSAMHLLPVDNYNILKYLCNFLKAVCDKSNKNKMNPTNIALVFGPNIIRHIDNTPELFMLTADLNQQLVFMMVHYFETVFMLDYTKKVRDVPVDDLLGLFNKSTDLTSPLIPSINPILADFYGIDTDSIDDFWNQDAKRKTLTLPVTRSRSSPSSPCSDLSFMDKQFPKSPDIEKRLTLPRFDEYGKPIPPKRKSKIIRGRRVSERRQNRNLSDSDNSNATTPDDLFSQFEVMKAVNIQAYVDDIDDKTTQLNNHKPISVSTSYSSTVSVNISDAATQTDDSDCNGEIEMNGKIQPSLAVLQLQVVALKDEIQRCKSKNDTMIKALKTELINMKEKYDKRIETMQVTNNTQLKTLQEKLEKQTKTAEDALARVVDLQSQLHDYHMHYGELNNNN